jgi:uncharacterized membrane protein YgcG
MSGHGKHICQDCQQDGKHQEHHLEKQYKRCILADAMDSTASRRICKCRTVPRFDANGLEQSIFPAKSTDIHRSTTRGAVRCGILSLGPLVAETKHEAVLTTLDDRRTLDEQSRISERKAEKLEAERALKAGARHLPNSFSSDRRRKSRTVINVLDEKEASRDIPFYIRMFTDRYPFGNVHMSLQLGPLLIENGVSGTLGGAVVTNRDPPIWHTTIVHDADIAYSLALTQDRELFYRYMSERRPKRYKTSLKQVVGGLFSGFVNAGLEDEIIAQVIASSHSDLESPEDHPLERKRAWNAVLIPIISNLRLLNGSRVETLLRSITQRLLDSSIDLKWDRRTNNCQMFCDNLIDHELYGSLVSNPGKTERLYMLSFVCRPGSYKTRTLESKFDVPSGLCEEYLFKFRYGLHVDSDIVDSLMEYWYDWGAFDGPLYRYQQLFPWDCTEAYSRSQKTCNDCDISKHVWAFPFDSWSLIQLHLTRRKLMYPEAKTPKDWVQNRLQLLLAHDALLIVGRCMAQSQTFCKSTAWMARQRDPKVDRLKLGGIHRAQPFSHNYEQGRYFQYFISDWAHLRREDQIASYEAMRNDRRSMPDFQTPHRSSDPDDMYDNMFLFYWGDDYYSDGWDGAYSLQETVPAEQAALAQDMDVNGGGDDGGGGSFDVGGSGYDGGGGGGGGDGGGG